MYMRTAALYDIHGNLPALEAVLRDVRLAGVDRVVVGGDVLPGPMPGDALDALFALDVPVTFITGNGEVAVLAERAGRDSAVPPQYRGLIQWVASEISDEHARRIEAWPKISRLGDVLFCHATPRSETEIFVRTTPEAALIPIFAAAGAPTVVCGHTHMPFARQVDRRLVVNAGSVGMPYGAPGPSWALLTPDGVQLRRAPFDAERAADRIVRESTYPGRAEWVDEYVRTNYSDTEALEAFRPRAES